MVSERFKDRKRLGLERVIGREEAEWRDPLRVPLKKKMRARSARVII